MNDYQIKKLYEEMEMHLIESMKRNLGRHLTEENKVGFKFTQWQAEKLKELKRYQRENKQIIGRYTLGLDKDVSEHLQNELRQGSINAIKQYNKVLGKNLNPSKVMNKSFFKTNDKKVNALIKVVNNDLKTANTSALRMMNDQYRQIIHKSAFFVGNGVFTEKQAAAQAVNEINQKKLTTLAVDEASKNFLAGGLNCIEYSDGRRVNIASYAQMAVRTASLRTHLMGEGNFRASIGRTLVKVTTHGGACPLCTKWQGKILIDDVYSGGTSKDGKYTLLSDAMKQGFLHPNCRHGLTTYYPELEEDDEVIEPVSEEQEETQQQLNYAIRNVKKYRRLEKGSLAKDNVERYSLKRKQWTNEAKQLDKEKLKNSLHNVEADKMKLKHEVGTILDKRGNILEVIGGEEHQVNLNDAQILKLKNNIFTHNHPTGGCFTKSDLESFIKYDLFEVRASTPQGTYFSVKKGNSNLKGDDFIGAFMKERPDDYSKATKVINEGLQAGTIDVEEYKRKGFGYIVQVIGENVDDWLEQNASKYGYIYSKGEL